MELIKHDLNIDFVGKIKLAVALSLVAILIGFGSMIFKGGLSYGVDFSGGILVQVKFAQGTSAGDIKQALKDLNLGGVAVQAFGDEANEFMIRAQSSTSEFSSLSDSVKQSLEKTYGAGSVEVRRAEMVGPQVGKDLRKKGMLALVYALIGTLIYIAWRFELPFAIGAILALTHDVLITLGAFSLFNREIDLPIIAAFLAIIGYSLNDTIIIYDRIRENRGRYSKESFPVIVNRSVNETMSRTIMTTGTTLLVVIALFIFGGGVIHNFAFALLIGITVGTYSTIFIASAFVLAWDKWQAGRSSGLTPAKGKTT